MVKTKKRRFSKKRKILKGGISSRYYTYFKPKPVSTDEFTPVLTPPSKKWYDKYFGRYSYTLSNPEKAKLRQYNGLDPPSKVKFFTKKKLQKYKEFLEYLDDSDDKFRGTESSVWTDVERDSTVVGDRPSFGVSSAGGKRRKR